MERIRKAYPLVPAKLSKYRARRTQGYASGLEAKRASELRILAAAGHITALREQVPFTLLPAAKAWGFPRPMVYRADFVYRNSDGEEVIEDSKGYATKEWKIKKRLMRQLLGIEVVEV